MHDIEHLGKGAIPDSPDVRDFVFKVPVEAVVTDWDSGFFLTEPPNEDQNGSGSCVGQGWSYNHWAVRPKDYCRRDIYAWIFYPGGGAQIRDGGLRIVNFGQDTRNNVQDPNPETEAGMEDKTGLDPNREKINQELNSFIVPKDIDNIAAAIKLNKGVTFGLIGTNKGWQNIAMPRPPMAGDDPQWGHCLYLFGYHMHNGKKCLVAKSSWGNAGGTTQHHITEDYFINNGAYIFNPWTLVPKGAITRMLVFYQVKGSKTVWALMDGEWVGFADETAFGNYLDGRPNVIINLDQVEFNKLKANSDVFKV